MAITETALIGLTPPLTAAETSLLAAMMHPSSKLSVLIPPNATREDLLSNLNICCTASVWADKTMRKINPIIGRILLVIRDQPDTFQSVGYESFGEFVTGYVHGKFGYSRSAAYESMRLVEAHPSLPIEKWMSIGVDRLAVLSKFTKEGDPSYAKHLAVAEQSETTALFKQWAHDKGHIDKGEVNRATVIIETTKLQAEHWKNFIADPRTQATAGGSAPELIFGAMLAECSSFLTEDGTRPKQVVEYSDVAFIWRCEKCHHSGIIPSAFNGQLNDLRFYVHDAHQEMDKNCVELVGNLLFMTAESALEPSA